MGEDGLQRTRLSLAHWLFWLLMAVRMVSPRSTQNSMEAWGAIRLNRNEYFPATSLRYSFSNSDSLGLTGEPVHRAVSLRHVPPMKPDFQYLLLILWLRGVAQVCIFSKCPWCTRNTAVRVTERWAGSGLTKKWPQSSSRAMGFSHLSQGTLKSFLLVPERIKAIKGKLAEKWIHEWGMDRMWMLRCRE